MPITTYRGTLTYSGLKQASVVTHFQFIGSDWLALDITEKRGESGQVSVRFLGISEKQPDGEFRSPWIYLTNDFGGDLVELGEPYSQITLNILEAGEDHVQVSGQWNEWGAEPYEFNGHLQRALA